MNRTQQPLALHRTSLASSLKAHRTPKSLPLRFKSARARVLVQVQLLLLLLLLLLSDLTTNAANAMRIVLQRVKSASVTVDNKVISSIGPGCLALVGLHEHDNEENLQECCKKLLAAKLWENDNGGQWRHGVKQKDYEVLCVSQFTLYGTLSKKNQPDYKLAMKAVPAKELYTRFLSMLSESYDEGKIFDGQFGAMMDVQLVNDGPVTLVIESEPRAKKSAQEE